MTDKTYDVAVLGSGPAGLTAALYAHRAGLEVLFIGGNSPGGKVMTHPLLENYPPFPGGVTGAELMIRWVKQVSDELGEGPDPIPVTGVDLGGPVKTLETASGPKRARGRDRGPPGPRRVDWACPGKWNSTAGACSPAPCATPRSSEPSSGSGAVVVGGGNTAVHTALGLLPHAETVTLVTRGPRLRAEPVLVDRFEKSEKSAFMFERNVKGIEGEAWVTGVALESAALDGPETLEADAVFVGVGQSPTTDFLAGALELDGEGFIQVNERLRTSVPGVFAAGDVRVGPLKQIISAAADGALAASSAAAYLAGL